MRPKQPSSLSNFVFYGSMCLLVGALVYLAEPARASKLFPDVDNVTLVLLCVLSHFLAVTAREVGRVAFGRLAGQRMVHLKLGPLLMDPVFGKRKPNRARFFPFAYSAMTPPESGLARLMHVLGGPLTNLIVGICALLIYQRTTYLGGLSLFLLLMFGMNVFLALWQLIPMRLNGVPNRTYIALRKQRAHLQPLK